MTLVERVRKELTKYEHPLMEFSAVEHEDGSIELLIELKSPAAGAHEYKAPIHPRDMEGGQFPWNLQRYLYDCLHDYMVELFVRTPQIRELPS
jgi:hypothetical protein